MGEVIGAGAFGEVRRGHTALTKKVSTASCLY